MNITLFCLSFLNLYAFVLEHTTWILIKRASYRSILIAHVMVCFRVSLKTRQGFSSKVHLVIDFDETRNICLCFSESMHRTKEPNQRIESMTCFDESN